MTTSPVSTDAANLDQLDATSARLGQIQSELMRLLLECAEKHQALDAEYAPQINSLAREAQETFLRAKAHADAARPNLLKRGSKTAQRLTGRHSWRSVTRVGWEMSDEELHDILKGLGQRFARRFVRRVRSWEINRNAFNLKDNRELVAQIPGVTLSDSEEYSLTPSGGVPMSTAQPWWPMIEGLPLPEVARLIFRGPEA